VVMAAEGFKDIPAQLLAGHLKKSPVSLHQQGPGNGKFGYS
jgi:hypothetical protein